MNFYKTMSALVASWCKTQREKWIVFNVIFHIFLILGLANIVVGAVWYTITEMTQAIFTTGTVPIRIWIVFFSSMALGLFWVLFAQQMQFSAWDSRSGDI